MPDVRIFPDAAALADAAAEHVAQAIRTTAAPGRPFALVLAGGSTPRALYERLATAGADLPWAHVHVFWGDERCVPPDHADSNYRMARGALLAHVPIPEASVHRLRGELPPAEAAAAAERDLRAFFGARPPAFDLALLGMGEDGHTASLFPGAPALEERRRLVVATEAPPSSPVHDRLTFTLPLLAHAREVLMLVAGASKRAPLAAALAAPSADAPLPAGRVAAWPCTRWFIDADAAGDFAPPPTTGG